MLFHRQEKNLDTRGISIKYLLVSELQYPHNQSPPLYLLVYAGIRVNSSKIPCTEAAYELCQLSGEAMRGEMCVLYWRAIENTERR
jgi:hypothetical protein